MFGWKADPESYRRTPFQVLAEALGLSSSGMPDFTINCALVDAFVPVRNQGNTSRCTGFAVKKAISATLALAGTPLPFEPSPTCLYTNGRAIDRGPDGPPLVDDGASPNEVWRAASTFGVRPWRDEVDGPNVAPEVLNAEPGASDLLAESAALVVGEYGIPAIGAALEVELRMALAAKRYVTAALCGSGEPIQRYTGGVLTGAMLGDATNHCVTVEDYAVLPKLGGVYLMAQSWGDRAGGWGVDTFTVEGLPAAWRARGRFLVDSTAVRTMRDLVVADVKIKESK